MINVKPEWYKDNTSLHLAASPENESRVLHREVVTVSPCHVRKWVTGNNSKTKCWRQCLCFVFVMHISVQWEARQKKKRSQPSLNPFSLPHIIWLYSCLSLLHCHLSYNLKGSQMPSHFSPWSCQVGSPKVLVTNVSPQPLKSKGPRGFFKQARLSGWQLAQLRPVTLIQHLARR